MFDWVDNVFDWFYAIGEAVDELIYNYNIMVIELTEYIRFSTYYVYGSGVMLIILFLLLVSQGRRLKRIEKVLEDFVSNTHEIKDDVKGLVYSLGALKKNERGYYE